MIGWRTRRIQGKACRKRSTEKSLPDGIKVVAMTARALTIVTISFIAPSLVGCGVPIMIGLAAAACEIGYPCGGGSEITFQDYNYDPARTSPKQLSAFETKDWSSICGYADNGDGWTRSAIGTHYRYGIKPFRADEVMAYKWYSLAIASGYGNASAYRDELQAKMTAEAVAEGERLTTLWSPGLCIRELSIL